MIVLAYFARGMTNSDGLVFGLQHMIKRPFMTVAWAVAARRPIRMLPFDKSNESMVVYR